MLENIVMRKLKNTEPTVFDILKSIAERKIQYS